MKLKKARLSKQNMFVLGIFLITIFFVCTPLMTGNCINGHDIEYHLLRIEALKEGILMGKPFLKINVLFFGGQGYASSLFYPDFLLYIPAVLRALGVGINTCYHIFIAFCLIATYASAFYCTQKITGSVYSASAAAVILTLSQYHVDDIYTRSAAGEYTAFIFLPFVVFGLYELVNAKIEHPAMMGIGMAGVLLCHTTTTVFCIGLYLTAFLFSFSKYWKQRKELLKLCVTAIFVAVLTSFYWVPILEQFMSASFHSGDNYFDLAYGMLQVREIFRNMNPGMGIVPFLLLLPGLFVRHEKTGVVRFADICTVFGILFTLGATNLFPWARVQNILGFVQFPWRLFIMSCVLLSVSASIYMEEFVKLILSEIQTFSARNVPVFQTRMGQIAFLFLLGAALIGFSGNIQRNEEGYYSYSDDYYSYAPFTGNVIGGEWLPAGVSDRDALIRNADMAEDNIGNTYEVMRKKNEMYVSDISADASYVDVPYIYYKGYCAEDVEGNVLSVDGNGTNGQCRVMLESSRTVHIYYGGTVLQKVSLAVSVSAVVLLCAAFFYKTRKAKV